MEPGKYVYRSKRIKLDGEKAHAEAIGRNIRAARNKKGLTLSEAALAAGISYRSLVGYEQGYRNITVRDLYRLSITFNVPWNDLTHI